jgi:hypothetical protein
VKKSVEYCGCDDGVSKNLAPLADGPIGCDHDATMRNSQAEVSPKCHGVCEFGFGCGVWADIDGRI